MTGKTTGRIIAPTAAAPATQPAAAIVATPSDCSQLSVKYHDHKSIAIDRAGNFYVTDAKNYRIRKYTKDGRISTIAIARFLEINDIAIDKEGNIYATYIRGIIKITPKGEIIAFAGSGESGHVDGPANSEQFYIAQAIAIDTSGNLYVSDYYSIRKVTPMGEVSTLAGSRGTRGVDGGFADGAGSAAKFREGMHGIAVDKAGNLYVADTYNHNIRKITPQGVVTTFAGDNTTDQPEAGYVDGQGNAARFHEPRGIVMDTAGNLYVADGMNRRIRKVTPEGVVSTFAGSGKPGEYDSEFISTQGSEYVSIIVEQRRLEINGGRDVAQFEYPYDITMDTEGNLYVADGNNPRIRKVTPEGEVSTLDGIDKNGYDFYLRETSPKGKVSTFAGGEAGFADGSGTVAQFSAPLGIAIDAAGNLYVADYGNHRIRRITPKGEVDTLAGGEQGFADGIGSAARFNEPFGITTDAAGNLFVADYGNNRIRRITPKGKVDTLAGGEQGFADGVGSAARFSGPYNIATDAMRNLYVSDYWNSRIRKISPAGEVSTIAGSERGFVDDVGTAAQFNSPLGIAIDVAGNIYVVDGVNHSIRKITPTGDVSTLAGNGKSGYADGVGTAAQFKGPTGIAIDAAGNLYVTDGGNHRIRKIVIK